MRTSVWAAALPEEVYEKWKMSHIKGETHGSKMVASKYYGLVEVQPVSVIKEQTNDTG